MESPHQKLKSYLENQPTVHADLNGIHLKLSTESPPSVSFTGGSSSSYVLGPKNFPELYTTVDELQSQIMDELQLPSTERIIITFNKQDVNFQIYYNLDPAEKRAINELLQTQHPQTISNIEASAFSTMSFNDGYFRKQTRIILRDDVDSESTPQSRDLPKYTTIPNTFRKIIKERAEKHPDINILTSDVTFQYTYNNNVEQFHIDFSTEYPVFPNISFGTIS